MQKIVDEGNDMGVYLFTLLGGEPFMWDELLDFARENKDAYFQVFTNGTLLDHDTIDELAKVGNIAPMLSLEGSPELTDQRRGDGVHDQVMEIMDHLGEAGVLFGYSCTVTRDTGRPSSATSSSTRSSPRARSWRGTSSTCRSGAIPTRA